MSKPRLKSVVSVQALLGKCRAQGLFATVLKKGFEDAGAIFVKLRHSRDECVVFSPVYDGEGNQAWLKATGENPVPEQAADAIIAREANIDPDLWAIEIECPEGWQPFEDDMVIPT